MDTASSSNASASKARETEAGEYNEQAFKVVELVELHHPPLTQMKQHH